MLLPRQLRLILDHVPLRVTQKVVERVFSQAMGRHPRLFDRLGEHASKRFCFRPNDLGLSFVIQPTSRAITTYKSKAPKVDATVSGPLLTLLALLEGRVDGDAVFFSRSLELTADMEAMLALRNALDDSGFDLPADLSSIAGPLAPVVRKLAERVRERALAEFA